MTIKKKRRGLFSDDMFDVFSDFEDEFERMSEEIFKNSDIFEQFKKMPRREGNPLVYGFSMKIGPDGKPDIKQFGNVPKMMKDKEVTDEREPLIDVINKKEEVCVIAEVPGVNREDINLTINNDKMTIDVKNPDRNYNKTITLPADVDPGSAKANYKNGVLEVTLCKTKKKIKGRTVEVK